MSCRKITNQPKEYSWGSTTLIPEFIGIIPNGKPQAEIWFGTHQSSVATFIDNEQPIDEVVHLPFMVKLLAAAQPLSIQVHPNKEQAQMGFVKENIAKIHINAFNRNYKDDNHKPEMIIALSNTFRALCGFQDRAKSIATLAKIISYAKDLKDINTLNTFHDKLVSESTTIKDLLKELLTFPNSYEIATALSNTLNNLHVGEIKDEHVKTLKIVSEHFRNDIGLTVAVMMNTVVLKKGESLYLPAGNIHAYVEGLGIEIMANSDNVLRGGLTNKYIDPDELLEIVDTSVLMNPVAAPEEKENIRIWNLEDDFTVFEVSEAFLQLDDETFVVVALEDSIIKFANEKVEFKRGEAALITNEDSCETEGLLLFVR